MVQSVVASIHSIFSTHYAQLISFAPEMDLIDTGFGLKLTTEAQRPRRGRFFPGREPRFSAGQASGQGKETAGFAGKAV